MSQAAASLPNLAQRASRAVEIVLTTLLAWSFGLLSVGVLLYVASGLWRGDYEVASPLSAGDPGIMAVGGVSAMRPWALTFEGRTGALVAAGLGLGVAAALGLSMAFAANPRRLGLLLLAAWAGLCAADGVMVVANTWNGAGFDIARPVLAGSAALVIVFGCMVHRMMLMWRMRVVLV